MIRFSDVPKICIVLTDGRSTWERRNTIETAMDARNTGIRILVVGISKEAYEPEIKLISSEPQEMGKTYWMISDFNSLEEVREDVMKQSCKDTPAPG